MVCIAPRPPQRQSTVMPKKPSANGRQQKTSLPKNHPKSIKRHWIKDFQAHVAKSFIVCMFPSAASQQVAMKSSPIILLPIPPGRWIPGFAKGPHLGLLCKHDLEVSKSQKLQFCSLSIIIWKCVCIYIYKNIFIYILYYIILN